VTGELPAVTRDVLAAVRNGVSAAVDSA
jgi:hypothetical protein